MSIISRDIIVAEARSWIGTKFHHQGRIKKSGSSLGGCDCLGLVIGTGKALSLKDLHGNDFASIDTTLYPELPDGEYLYKKLSYHFKQKEVAEMSVGDLGLFLFAKNPQHLAIIGASIYGLEKKLTLIHGYSVTGSVCEHIFCPKWRNRLVAVFSFV